MDTKVLLSKDIRIESKVVFETINCGSIVFTTPVMALIFVPESMLICFECKSIFSYKATFVSVIHSPYLQHSKGHAPQSNIGFADCKARKMRFKIFIIYFRDLNSNSSLLFLIAFDIS